MDNNLNFEKYADLIVNIGLGLHAGDKLSIRMSEPSLALARLVAKKAYQKGVSDVRLDFSDDTITLDRYLHAPDEAFEIYPDYQVDYSENLFKDGYHVLNLYAPNPDLLKPADPARIAQWQKVAGKAVKRIQHYTMQNEVKWCVTAVACPAWAAAAFPQLSEEEAMQKLWDNIFMATRVDQPDPVAAWEEHDLKLKAHRKFLNDARFDRVHYQGPGTDLMVGLVKTMSGRVVPDLARRVIVSSPTSPPRKYSACPMPTAWMAHCRLRCLFLFADRSWISSTSPSRMEKWLTTMPKSANRSWMTC